VPMEENTKANTVQTPNSFFMVVSFSRKFLERPQHPNRWICHCRNIAESGMEIR